MFYALYVSRQRTPPPSAHLKKDEAKSRDNIPPSQSNINEENKDTVDPVTVPLLSEVTTSETTEEIGQGEKEMTKQPMSVETS